MGRTLKHISFLLLAGLIAGMAACDSEGCEGNQSSLPLAGFYSSQTQSKITIDSITVYGIGVPGDSAIIRCTAASQTYMPFNLSDTTSRFVVKYEQAALAAFNLSDTITIDYESIPYFHSSDCGAMYNFAIHDYRTTHTLIDSIQIPTSTIDNTNIENIKLFFRTEEADEE